MILGLAIIATLTDWAVSRRYWDSNEFKYAAWNDIIKGGMDNDIIIMGSSRAWVHFSPAILDSILGTKTYNLGIDGSCIERQIPRYNLYKLYSNKPKVILQNVDWGSTLEYEEKNYYLIEQYYPYFYDKGMRNIVLPEEGFSFLDMHIPLLRYLKHWSLLDAWKDANARDNIVIRGYRGMERDWNGDALRKIDSIHFRYYDESKDLFCNYLKQCKDDSVKVIFVYAPFYIEGINKISNIQDFYNVFDSIAKQYDCTILNYLNSPICNDTNYFYNASHLNKAGSEIFSTILAHDLDSLHLFEK